MTERVKIFDAVQGKYLDVQPKQAARLCTQYPTRFSFANLPGQLVPGIETPNHIEVGRIFVMPQLPQETKALENGVHTLIATEVKTTRGAYGEQEEVICMDEETGENTRVWISHNARKKIMAAQDAGLVSIDPANDEWHVIIGARFCVMIAGGKMVGYSKPKPRVITNGATGEGTTV